MTKPLTLDGLIFRLQMQRKKIGGDAPVMLSNGIGADAPARVVEGRTGKVVMHGWRE